MIDKFPCNHGEEVKILLRKTSRTENIDGINAERVYGDITDLPSLESAIKGCQTLYHTAGYVSFRKKDYKKLHDINVGGTINAMKAALNEGVKKVIYTSSVAAVGVDPYGGTATEKTPFTLEHEGIQYLNTKYHAELEALKFANQGLPVVIVNPSVVIGPGDVYLSSTAFIQWYCKKKFPGYMDGTLNMVDVEDVAYGHLLAAEKGKVGERYILGNRNLTLDELFDMLESITGISRPRLKIPYTFAYISGYLVERILGFSFPNFSTMDVDSVKLSKYKWFVDSSKAVNELGYKMSSIEDSVRKTIEWYKEHGYL